AEVTAARDLVQDFGIQRHALGRRRHVDHGAAAGDGYRFLEAADLHDDVDFRVEANRQTELVADQGGEAGQVEGDLVHAHRKLGEAVVAGRVAGGCDLTHLQGRAGQGRDHAGQRRARLVGDDSVDDAR